jgi:hypothetical protein
MMDIQKFLGALKTAGTNPIALVGYLVVVAAWVYVKTTDGRLKFIAKTIKDLPETDRLEILKKEYNTTPRKGLSAEEWIKSRKQLLLFFGFITTVLAIVVIGLAAISRSVSTADKPASATNKLVTVPSPPVTNSLPSNPSLQKNSTDYIMTVETSTSIPLSKVLIDGSIAAMSGSGYQYKVYVPRNNSSSTREFIFQFNNRGPVTNFWLVDEDCTKYPLTESR